MALTLNGSNNTIAGLAVGGLPDGIVDTDMIADGAATGPKQGAGSIIQVVDRNTEDTANYADDDYQLTAVYADINPLHSNSKFLLETYFSFGVGDHDTAVSCNFADSLHQTSTTTPLAPHSTTGGDNNGAAGSRMAGYFGFGSFAGQSDVDNWWLGQIVGRYLYTPNSSTYTTNTRRFTTMIRSSTGKNVRINMNGQNNTTDPRDVRIRSCFTIYEVKA